MSRFTRDKRAPDQTERKDTRLREHLAAGGQLERQYIGVPGWHALKPAEALRDLDGGYVNWMREVPSGDDQQLGGVGA